MVNVIDRMDRQSAEVSSSRVPFFFKLADGERAVIRPLLNLDSAYPVLFHKVFDPIAKNYQESICAQEIGEKCRICQEAQVSKDRDQKRALAAKEMFMLPVWLHVIKSKQIENGMEVLDGNDNPVFADKTYTNKETGEEKLVSGVRVMQLMFKGSSFVKVSEAFRDLYKAGMDITDRDFIIQRVGGSTDTSYIPGKRQPSPFNVQLDFSVDEEWLKKNLMEKYPPVSASSHPAKGKNTDPSIAAVVQGVKNGHQAVDSFDDTIMDF